VKCTDIKCIEENSDRFSVRKIGYLFVLAISLTIAGIAYAGEAPRSSSDLLKLGPDELMQIEVATVYSASRYEQTVDDAPSSITIVTADEIKKYGYRTLADILRSVRSFYVTYDRNYSYLGIRGFSRPGDYDTRILLLVDGHRINDNIYDTGPIGTEFPLDVDLIDRIEIIRGPTSSLYGDNAFFGVINVISRDGRDFKGFEASGSAGSHSTYRARLSYGNKFRNGPELLLSGTFYDSDGRPRLFFKEFDSPATNNGIADHTDNDRSYSFFSKLSLDDFTLEGVYASREKRIPTGSFGTVFDDPRNRTADIYGYLELRYEHNFSNQLELSARLSYNNYNYHGEYIYNMAEPGENPFLVLNKDTGNGTWWGGGIADQEKDIRETAGCRRSGISRQHKSAPAQLRCGAVLSVPG
jgi:outer membrane receptor protein involved in Fe transport